MIDYIRLRLDRAKYFDVFNNPSRYNLTQQYHLANDSLSQHYIGYYDKMTIEINPHHIVIRGSLHKFYNSSFNEEDQNFSDFTYTQLVAAIDRLSQRLKFDPTDAIIENLEFGVNIELDTNVKDFLNKNLLMMKGREASNIEEHGKYGQLRRFTFSQYDLKVYDKGSQYKLDKNVLRLEVKTKKSAFFTTDGMKWTLQDLKSKNILGRLQNILIEKANELCICNQFELIDIDQHEDWTALIQFTNPKYWTSLKKNSTYYRRKKKFGRLIEKYKLDELKKEVIGKTKSKSKLLLKT